LASGVKLTYLNLKGFDMNLNIVYYLTCLQ